jgi:hypothetical protein
VDSDNRLILVIGAILVAAVAVPVALWQRHETRRPVLQEARIVTATSSDPVYREGSRHAAPGETVKIALALRVAQPGRSDYWLAPVPRLVIDGHEVDHVAIDRWPEDDRVVRVFWFSVECAFLGGDISQDTAGERLSYRTFLAPEMGRELRAAAVPAVHADDYLGGDDNPMEVEAGTFRLYARAEVVADPGDVQPLHAASSHGLDHLEGAAFPTIHRAAILAPGLEPEVGELFRLPGYEPAGDTGEARDQSTVPALGRTFSALVEQRLVTSSESFAAVAVSGMPRFASRPTQVVAQLSPRQQQLTSRGRTLRWAEDVRAGDLLVDGSHWLVLIEDDGDGLLGGSDRVAHSWRRPAVVEPLLEAFDGTLVPLDLVRWEEPGPVSAESPSKKK